MKYFGTSRRLRSLPVPLRVLLSFYLLTVLLGLVSSSLKYAHRTGISAAGVATYYAGSDEPAGEMEPRKSVRFLNDVTHPHLFTVPIVLLVVCHLVHMTNLPAAVLIVLDSVCFGGFLVTFGVPWLLPARPGLAPVLVIGGLAFLLATAAECLLALVHLWLPKRPE